MSEREERITGASMIVAWASGVLSAIKANRENGEAGMLELQTAASEALAIAMSCVERARSPTPSKGTDRDE